MNSGTEVRSGERRGGQGRERALRGAASQQGGRWRLVLGGVSRVEFAQGALRDPLQHFFGEDSEQLPANVQSLVDSAIFVRTLQKIEIG